jgi:dihydrofolate reductase
MRTVYHTAATLDGFVATTDHDIGWLMQFSDEGQEGFGDFLAGVGAIAMGAHTYEWMLRHHVAPTDGEPQPWPYEAPTWVFSSRSLPRVGGAEVHLVRGDVRPIHDAMAAAAAGRDVWVVGGGDLAGQFLDAGLLDRIVVTVAPVTLGRGMPLLPRSRATRPFTLVGVRQVGRDFAELTYDVGARA